MRNRKEKMKKSLLKNSPKTKHNKKISLKTNLNLLTKLLTKKRNHKMENSSKQHIKSYLRKNNQKKVENYNKKEIEDQNNLLIFLFQNNFIEKKNKLISYHHGIKNLMINSYEIKKFIKFIHKIVEQNKKRKLNLFFERLMMLKLKENLKKKFLHICNQILVKNNLKKKKIGFQTLECFSLCFDIYNNLYRKNENDWKNGTLNILKEFDRRPKALFSIANKNPFYFKFLVFFKQINEIKKKREAFAFGLIKKLHEKKNLEEENLKKSKRNSKKNKYTKNNSRKSQIKRNFRGSKNSNYSNSENENELNTTDLRKNFNNNSQLEKRLTKSSKYSRKLQNKFKERKEPPNYLIEDSTDSNNNKEKEIRNNMKTGNEFKNEEYEEKIHNLKKKKNENEIICDEFENNFKKKSTKVNKYVENINNLNYARNHKNNFSNSEENFETKSNLKYKRILAKKINRKLKNNSEKYKNQNPESENYIIKTIVKEKKQKKKSSKMIFLILKEMILKRLKNSIFKIQNVKRKKKSEKILYAKVKILKRPIQYTMEVNQDDLRSMNIPIPNNQLRINKSQPNFFDNKTNKNFNSMSIFNPPNKKSLYDNFNHRFDSNPNMFRSQIQTNNYSQRNIQSYVPNLGSKRSFEMKTEIRPQNKTDGFLKSNKKIFLKKNNNNKSSSRNLILNSTKNFEPLFKKGVKNYSGEKFLKRCSQLRVKTENDKF